MSDVSKKILVISPVPFFPHAQGNYARIHALMSLIKELGWEITYLYVKTANDEDLQRMRDFLDGRLYVFGIDCSKFNPLPPTKTVGLLQCFSTKLKRIAGAAGKFVPESKLLAVFRRLRGPLFSVFGDRWFAFRIDDYYPPELDRFVGGLAANHDFAAVLIEYAWLSHAFTVFGPSTLKILDTHDIYSRRHRIFAWQGIEPGGFSTTPDQEAIALNRADVVWAIQDTEADFFRRLTEKRVLTVGHVVVSRFNTAAGERYDPSNILIVGSDNICNRFGIKWFIQEVFPALVQRKPEIKLIIAGGIGDAISDHPRIEKLGYIDCLADAYSRADISINPVYFGTGLKIKTIDALSFGHALVTAPNGASGIEEWEERAFLVARSKRQFIRQIERLLEDRSERERLKAGAKELFEQHFLKGRQAVEQTFVLSPSARHTSDLPGCS